MAIDRCNTMIQKRHKVALLENIEKNRHHILHRTHPKLCRKYPPLSGLYHKREENPKNRSQSTSAFNLDKLLPFRRENIPGKTIHKPINSKLIISYTSINITQKSRCRKDRGFSASLSKSFLTVALGTVTRPRFRSLILSRKSRRRLLLLVADTVFSRVLN